MPEKSFTDVLMVLVCLGGIALSLALLYYHPFQKAIEEEKRERKRQRRIARGLPPDEPRPRPLTKAELEQLDREAEREEVEAQIRQFIGYYDDLPWE